MGNPAEETYCYPNIQILCSLPFLSIPRQLMLTPLMHRFFHDFIYEKLLAKECKGTRTKSAKGAKVTDSMAESAIELAFIDT